MTIRNITWRQALGWLVALVILFFLVRALWTSWDQVAAAGVQFQLNLPLLALSLVLLVIGRSFAVEAWRRILGALGSHISFRFSFYAWFISNLARYVPGNVWQLAAMMFLTAGAGVSRLNVLLAQAVYAAIALSVAALYGLTLLPVAQEYLPIVALAFAALVVVFALPPVLPLLLRVSARGLRLVRRNKDIAPPRVPPVPFRQGLLPPLFSLTMWTINGIAFWLFVRSLVEVPLAALPSFVAMNAAAYFIGYVSFITPSGLGFREASLALMLGAFFPEPVAIAIAFATRLWSTAGEFLGVGIALWGRPGKAQVNPRMTMLDGSPQTADDG